MKLLTGALSAALCACACHVGAVTIATQDFEGNSTATGTGERAPASPFPTDPGLTFDSGRGLGWSVGFVNTRNVTRPSVTATEGDLIGVVNSGIPRAINGDGTNHHADSSGASGNYFNVDDADGMVRLTFDTIDASGYENLMLFFAWAVESDRYEAPDVFDVSVNATSVFRVAGSALASGAQVDAFKTETIDLSDFDRSLLNIVVSFDNNRVTDDIAFDSLVLSGDPLPTPIPGSAVLLLTALAGLAYVRRRV